MVLERTRVPETFPLDGLAVDDAEHHAALDRRGLLADGTGPAGRLAPATCGEDPNSGAATTTKRRVSIDTGEAEVPPTVLGQLRSAE